MSEDQTQTPPQEVETPSLVSQTPAQTTPTESETPSPETSNDGTDPAPETQEEEAAPAPLTADDLSFPEDFTVPDESRDKFLEILNGEMTPQERANALIEFHVESLRTASEKISEVWKETRENWVNEAKAHPKFGGAKFDANMAQVAKLLDEFAPAGIRENVFDLTGAGDHPMMIEFLINMANALAEGRPVQPSSPSATSDDLASKLYPTMKG